MASTIIPATAGWVLAESILSEEWEHIEFAYSPIIAWVVSDSDEGVRPITVYGRPETTDYLLKAPDGVYWDHDWGMDEVGAVKLAGKWAKDSKEKFDSTSKKTVAPSQAIDIMVGPEGFEPPTRPL